MALNPIEAGLLPLDNQILSVSAFTRRVKNLLESQIPEVWIRGEISNFRRQSSGHCYFSLKDEGSQVSAVFFRGDAARLSLALRDGLQVVAFGQTSVYEPRGNYQIKVRLVIEDGLGRLQLEFARLKQRLAEEGLFDSERKKALPLLPQTLGFVTSPTGAAIRDFISILRRRRWRGHVIVLPVKVQGAGAAEEIVAMIELAQALGIFDLLVVGRGGGSLEDLWPFNEEMVARAVAFCRIPLISAVGHEIDFTLSDFAADQRAETPSAAAELISSGFLKCEDRVDGAGATLAERVRTELERLAGLLELAQSELTGLSPVNRVEHFFLRLDDFTNRLRAALSTGVSEGHRRLYHLTERLAAISPETRLSLAAVRFKALNERYCRGAETALKASTDCLVHLALRLRNASPEQILKRGFVLVQDEGGNLVSRKVGLQVGRKLHNRFADGEIGVEVVSVAGSSL